MHTDVRGSEQNEAEYTTPRWVQVWFLRKSRRLWKSKYRALKVECKRLQNRVNDTTKSREKWRDDAKEFARRVRELEAENAALHSAALHSAALHSAALHSAALKKQG
jgi:hypothetical protein